MSGTNAERTGSTFTNFPAGWEFTETDTNPPLTYFWTGSAWRLITEKDVSETLTNKTLTSPTINTPTLGAPLSIANGGTSGGTATAGFDALSPMTTAGDIIIGGASGTRTRLGIGTAGQALKVNSGATAPEYGTLPVAGGGTGATTLTGVLIGTGTTAVTVKTNPSGAFVGDTDSQTLTNKTLTSPVISTISNTGTVTLPTATDTVVARATTDTLTNKTIVADSNTISATTNTTGQVLRNNGTKFVGANDPVFPSSGGTLSATNGRVWGVYVVAGGAQALGLLGSLTQLGGAPGFATFAAADGQKGARFTPAASSGALVGLSTATTISCRQWNPRFKVKFRLNNKADTRLMIGWNNTGGSKTTDDPLNAVNGIMFGKIADATNTNFVIMHNDGSGATVLDTVAAADNSIHQIQIRADDTNSQFLWSFDNGAETAITTDIPAQTTGLGWILEEETTNTTQPTIDVFWCEMESG